MGWVYPDRVDMWKSILDVFTIRSVYTQLFVFVEVEQMLNFAQNTASKHVIRTVQRF